MNLDVPPTAENVSEWIQAFVERDLAELEAASQLPPRGRRRKGGESIVYSIRLDPEEVATLERQAALHDLKPTVLARNLIRIGLARRGNEHLSRLVDSLEETVEQLRSVVR
jgi:hypothetical protein